MAIQRDAKSVSQTNNFDPLGVAVIESADLPGKDDKRRLFLGKGKS